MSVFTLPSELELTDTPTGSTPERASENGPETPSTLNPSTIPFGKASAVSSHHVDSLNDLSQDESVGIAVHSQTESGLEFRDYRP
ncbi:hypothetical protein EIP86_003815 [Pleurotus ostreatoroseus]|nr:hypothetical protein EIP86_003815 [Pleurotus ostreatoroseus]